MTHVEYVAISLQEDEEDGELRRSYRRRTYSGSSRRSVVSITSSAPATSRSVHVATSPPQSVHQASPPPSRSSHITFSHSSPTLPVSVPHQNRYHTFHHMPSSRHSLSNAFDLDLSKSPSLSMHGPPFHSSSHEDSRNGSLGLFDAKPMLHHQLSSVPSLVSVSSSTFDSVTLVQHCPKISKQWKENSQNITTPNVTF